jgi:hypothetical protein
MLRTARLGEEKREGVPQRLANTLLVQPAQRLIVQPACALTQALRRAYAEGDNVRALLLAFRCSPGSRTRLLRTP